MSTPLIAHNKISFLEDWRKLMSEADSAFPVLMIRLVVLCCSLLELIPELSLILFSGGVGRANLDRRSGRISTSPGTSKDTLRITLTGSTSGCWLFVQDWPMAGPDDSDTLCDAAAMGIIAREAPDALPLSGCGGYMYVTGSM